MSNLVTVKIPITNKLSNDGKRYLVDGSVVFNNCTGEFIAHCCEQKKTFGIYNQFYHVVKNNNPSALADMITTSAKKATALVNSHNGSLKRNNRQIAKRNKRRAHKGLPPLPFKERYVFKPNLSISGYSLTANMFSYKNGKGSLATINGRIKFEMTIPKWFDERYPVKRFYSGWISCKEVKHHNKECPATIDDREYVLYLTYIINEDNPVEMKEITPETVHGVDRGLYNIIALDDGTLISSEPYYVLDRKYAHNVKTLKQKHSSSARRRLRSMKGKRMRYNNDKNHVVSKFLSELPNTSCLVFEDLTGVNDKKSKGKNKNQKKANAWYHGWNFKDLEQKTKYKCAMKGTNVVYVSPAFTSKTCSECGYREQIEKECRDGAHFHCPECGHTEHADINAAKNIRDKYLESVGLFSTSTTENQRFSQGSVSNPSVKTLSGHPKGYSQYCEFNDSDASGSENYSASKPTSLGVGN